MPYIKLRKIDLQAARQEAKVSKLVVNGVKVVDITLTDALHKTAAKFGIATHEVNNIERAKGNGSAQVYVAPYKYDKAENEVAGKEGELAASIYLTGNEYAAMRQWVIGKSDSGDIAFWSKNQQNIIDVKTRKSPNSSCFRLTLKQWRNHCPDYYVATQYITDSREKVRIWGYVERRLIDALVISETKRILGKPLKWVCAGTGSQKYVKMTNADLENLAMELHKSPELCKLKEKEVNSFGIGELDGYYPPIIAVPFTQLSSIDKLKEIMNI